MNVQSFQASASMTHIDKGFELPLYKSNSTKCIDHPETGMQISGSGNHMKPINLTRTPDPTNSSNGFIRPVDPNKHKLYNFWMMIEMEGGHEVFMGPYKMSVGCTPIFSKNQHKVL